MALIPIRIDSAGGEYMETVVVLDWAAAPGDAVRAGQVIVTVETAKAATEIEAESDGFLAEIRFAQGQEAPIGAVLGMISDQPPVPAAMPDAPPIAMPDAPPAALSAVAPAAMPAVAPAAMPDAAPAQAGTPRWVAGALPAGARVVASPLARRIAAAAGVSSAGVSGTGPGGRIKRRDVDAALKASRARPAATPTAMQAAAPGGGVAAVPLVLLHGFGADQTSWRQVLPLLPAEMPTFTPDLPGHGARAAEPALSLDDLALAMSDRLEAAGIAACHLVGHSLGGAVALALTSLGRVAVRSLTLLAPAGLGPEINGGFVTGLVTATTAEALGPWLNLMVGDPAALPQGYARAAARQMDRTGARPALAAMAAALFPNGAQAFDVTRALASVEAPVRLLWGRADAVMPPAHAARAPAQCAVHLLPGVGHVPQIERPALTARLIVQTIRSAA